MLAGRRGTLGNKDLDDMMVTNTASRDKDGKLAFSQVLQTLLKNAGCEPLPTLDRKEVVPENGYSPQNETLLNGLTTRMSKTQTFNYKKWDLLLF